MCRAPLALALGAVIAFTGCAGRRIENGVYHSDKGYRLTLPGPDWSVAADSKADLELRQRALDRTAPPRTRRGRYTAKDELLAFLEAL